MPVTISLRFPAGRYHATVWGQHVNDERAEWPPSPWRFLRALAAVWKQRLGDDPVVAASVEGLFEKLAAVPPAFQLPLVSRGHTRHYMPTRDGRQDRPTLVLDRFVAIDRSGDPAYIHWPDASLTAEEHHALTRLLSGLTYLGRAESWCDAELCPESLTIRPNCSVRRGADDGIPVAVPDPASWSAWDYSKAVRRPDPPWNLLAESDDVIRGGWTFPPGCRWETYSQPPAEVGPIRQAGSSGCRTPRHSVARFVLDGPVLPLVTDTVRVAEAFRHRALARFQQCRHRREFGTARKPYRGVFRSESLSGKDATGKCLQSHGHAYYLPSAEHDQRRISHITVYARSGFDADEVAALTAIRQFEVRISADRSLDLRVQLVGLGQPGDFRAALFGPRRVWRSVTPFVGPAHIGRLSRDRYLLKAARREARRWAEDHGVPPPAVERIGDTDSGIDRPRSLTFRRSRARDGSAGYQRPCGLFRLRFEPEVVGPICLGYASHFGLGLFAPDTDAKAE